MPEWTTDAARELLALRGSTGAWPYRRGSAPSVEPTALAALAILATGDASMKTHAESAARWIARSQRLDGAVGLSADRETPGWPTPLALILWRAIGGFEAPAALAIRWLESIRGTTLKPSDDPERIAGHDTTLVGWPWVEQTHSWLEPTALSVLALERWGLREGPRVIEGRSLLLDRAIDGGGWNYGNKAAFGHPLRPQPGPTGLALLALSGRSRDRGPRVDEGIHYLEAGLPRWRASLSVGWALLGLNAWGVSPPSTAAILGASHKAATRRSDAPVKLAMLLLAANRASLALFGRDR